MREIAYLGSNWLVVDNLSRPESLLSSLNRFESGYYSFDKEAWHLDSFSSRRSWTESGGLVRMSDFGDTSVYDINNGCVGFKFEAPGGGLVTFMIGSSVLLTANPNLIGLYVMTSSSWGGFSIAQRNLLNSLQPNGDPKGVCDLVALLRNEDSKN
jgi:hypothetical protein